MRLPAGMSVATALIGAIPITPSAPYLLLLIKVLQGLFVSGEGASALVYSIERSHPVRPPPPPPCCLCLFSSRFPSPPPTSHPTFFSPRDTGRGR